MKFKAFTRDFELRTGRECLIRIEGTNVYKRRNGNICLESIRAWLEGKSTFEVLTGAKFLLSQADIITWSDDMYSEAFHHELCNYSPDPKTPMFSSLFVCFCVFVIV